MMKVFIRCKAYQTAKRRCPWAQVIARVEGGFMAFQYETDYRVWRAQK